MNYRIQTGPQGLEETARESLEPKKIKSLSAILSNILARGPAPLSETWRNNIGDNPHEEQTKEPE